MTALAFITLRWKHGRIWSRRAIGCGLGSKKLTPDASWAEGLEGEAGGPVGGLVSGVGQVFDGVCGLPPWFLNGMWRVGRGVLAGAGIFSPWGRQGAVCMDNARHSGLLPPWEAAACQFGFGHGELEVP